MPASGDLDGFIDDLMERARAFGAKREAKFQQALDLLHDLYGGQKNDPDDA